MKFLKKFVAIEFFDSLFSYVSCVAIVLAAVSFILMMQPQHAVWLILIQVSLYIPIIALSFWKILVREIELEKPVGAKRKCIILLVGLLILGCFVNLKYHLLATCIFLGSIFLLSKIRQCQNYVCRAGKRAKKSAFSRKFYTITQLILYFGPFVLWGIFWFQIPTISPCISIIVFLLFLCVLPIMMIFERAKASEEHYMKLFEEYFSQQDKDK